ncbi:Methyltransferase domain containing protein [Candidatus Nanopelagicaceae bacterium]
MLCEVCLDELIGPILDLGFHPLCDDLMGVNEAKGAKRYHQEIQLCTNCLTAHQLHPVRKEQLFKSTYRYRASLTQDVLLGMKGLVSEVAKKVLIEKDTVVVDIGCNDGSLLGLFKENFGCLTIGVDPTDAIQEAGTKIDVPIQNYFDADVASGIISEYGTPDVVTFTNVFAHIENFTGLVEAVRLLIGDATLLVIENHNLSAILADSQFDTFYHEHPRTYSAKSFSYIANRLGMQITSIEFPARYGGNIRVILQKSTEADAGSTTWATSESSVDLVEKFSNLQVYFEDWKIDSREVLNGLLSRNLVYGKGLPGRAVMLISSLEITENEMPAIFEQPSSPKVGYYLPGSLIEIKSDLDIPLEPNSIVIVWAWHIIEEVCTYLEKMGFCGEIWTPLPKFQLYKRINTKT